MRVALAPLLALALASPALAAQDAGDPRALVAAGGQALLSGDPEEAERLFAQASRADPDLAAAWLGMAKVRELQDRVPEALELARRAQALAPEEALTHRVVGRLLARLAADQAALEALARARALEPSEPEAYVLAALLLRRGGKVAEAAALLDEGLAAGADGAELRRELILLLLADGRPEEALAAAEEANERFAGDAGLELGMGLALASLPERRQEAPQWLEKALAGGVQDAGRVRLELGTVLLETGDAAAARPHFEAAAEALPGQPAVWYRLARARQGTGDADGAAAALARFQELSRQADATDHAGKRTGAALNEAQALAAADRLDEALQRVRALLAETPGEPRALALEAKVLYSLGRLGEALDVIRAAAAAAPGAVEYPYLEGLFLTELKRAKEAAVAFGRALDLDPGLADAWERLGRLALAEGQVEVAVTRFEKALELGAEGAALRLFYADALERAGRPDESRLQMEAYRRLHDGSSEPDS